MGPKVHGGYLDQIDQRLNGKLLLMGGLLMCFFVEELFANKRQNQPWGLVVEYHTINFM